jgi:hypothetical protein
MRIIPCHLKAEIFATPQQFREAFTFLDDQTLNPLPSEDFQLLREIEQNLIKLKILPNL